MNVEEGTLESIDQRISGAERIIPPKLLNLGAMAINAAALHTYDVLGGLKDRGKKIASKTSPFVRRSAAVILVAAAAGSPTLGKDIVPMLGPAPTLIQDMFNAGSSVVSNVVNKVNETLWDGRQSGSVDG